MRPELFRIADIVAPSYFILLLSGFIFATTMGVLWARRTGEDPDVIVDLGLSTLLMGVVGALESHPRHVNVATSTTSSAIPAWICVPR